MQVDSSPSVDVFVTAYNEEFTLIERCLQAACQMRGAHCTWLLDDGHDPKLEQLAERLGAGYLTRPHRQDAKAGNINTALPRTTGDIIAIFDIDHIPQADFLEQTLPFFANPRIGFVQVMLTFANSEESWVARAAIETSSDFYNATSIGADSIRGATLVGSNALIRRQALASIGGYQPGLAEDLATSIALHAAGWGSVYVRKPLAPGLAPPDLAAWFTQQLKWSRGVFDLLLTAYPHHFAALALGQKISYAVRMTYYWIGPAIFLHLLATWFVLYMGEGQFLAVFHEYLMHIVPLAFMTWLIRARSFRIWRHPTEQAYLEGGERPDVGLGSSSEQDRGGVVGHRADGEELEQNAERQGDAEVQHERRPDRGAQQGDAQGEDQRLGDDVTEGAAAATVGR